MNRKFYNLLIIVASMIIFSIVMVKYISKNKPGSNINTVEEAKKMEINNEKNDLTNSEINIKRDINKSTEVSDKTKSIIKSSTHNLLEKLNNCGINLLEFEDEVIKMVLGYPQEMLEDWIECGKIDEIILLMVADTTNQIYWFDLEIYELNTMYTDFVNEIIKLSNNEISFFNINEDVSKVDFTEGTGIQSLSFEYRGNKYFLDMEVNDDWFDMNIVSYINKILYENNSDKFLFALSDGTQGCYIFYNTTDWANNFMKNFPMFTLCGMDGVTD